MLLRRAGAAALTVALAVTGVVSQPAPAGAAVVTVTADRDAVAVFGATAADTADSLKAIDDLIVGSVPRPAGAPALPRPPKGSSGAVCRYVAIRAMSSRWIAPEFGRGGAHEAMVRARSTAVAGPWELYWLCRHPSTGAYFLEAQRNYNEAFWTLRAEMTYPGDDNGMIRAATSTDVTVKELFFIETPGKTFHQFKWWSGYYVASEEARPEPDAYALRARSGVPGIWENFAIYSVG